MPFQEVCTLLQPSSLVACLASGAALLPSLPHQLFFPFFLFFFLFPSFPGKLFIASLITLCFISLFLLLWCFQTVLFNVTKHNGFFFLMTDNRIKLYCLVNTVAGDLLMSLPSTHIKLNVKHRIYQTDFTEGAS